MRMKDSDDYITARAANPRTGLISPSVHVTTPRSPGTPGSPAEALKLSSQQQKTAENGSPTLAVAKRCRPLLSRANEGRKLDSQGKHWFTAALVGAAAAPASPRVTTTTDISVAKTRPPATKPRGPRVLGDDQFVMNMPSAAEPQPFEYPGFSAGQIEALEHYRSKTRKTSAEGYDQRLVCSGGVRKTSAGSVVVGGVRKVSPISGRRVSPLLCGSGHEKFAQASRALRACSGNAAKASLREGSRGAVVGEDEDVVSSPQISPATFAPFSSPKTPARREPETKYTAMRTMPGAYGDTASTTTDQRPDLKPRELVDGHGKANPQARQTCQTRPTSPDSTPQPLSQQLPRVRLVHPAQASKPRPSTQPARRTCSLGCTPDPTTATCTTSTQTRKVTPVPYPRWSLFDPQPTASDPASATQHPQSQALDLLLSTLLILLSALASLVRQISLPRLGALEALTAANASPRQKLEALKAVLSLCGQVLVMLLVLAVVVEVGGAVARVLGFVGWVFRGLGSGLGLVGS
ncbi:hypothetical protein MBLNU230_g0985t1 [Neophaeotheca triangularis]